MDAREVQALQYEEASRIVERIADLVGPNDTVLANQLYSASVALRALARRWREEVPS